MDVDAQLGGYAEVRGMYDVDVEGTPWTAVQKVRPTFEIGTGPRVRAFAAVEGTLVEGRSTSDEVAKYLEAGPLGPDLEEYCTRIETLEYADVRDYLTVERLYVDFMGKKADFRVGRQPLNWGSGKVFNPTDLYADVVAEEPWRERKGINAVRANISPLDWLSVTAVVAADDDLSAFEKVDAGEFPAADTLPFSGAVKVTARQWETDWSAVASGRADGRWFVGGDFQGTLGVGWWVEGGWHGDGRGVDPEGAEVVVGVDYSLDLLDRVYLAAEYRHDGTGEADPADYDYSLRSASDTAVPFYCATATVVAAEGEVQPSRRVTLGQHYVNGILNVQFLEDWTVSGVAVVNVVDGTGLLVPDVAVKLGDRWAVHAGAQVPFGAEGEFAPPDENFDVVFGANKTNLAGFVPAAVIDTWVRYSF